MAHAGGGGGRFGPENWRPGRAEVANISHVAEVKGRDTEVKEAVEATATANLWHFDFLSRESHRRFPWLFFFSCRVFCFVFPTFCFCFLSAVPSQSAATGSAPNAQ